MGANDFDRLVLSFLGWGHVFVVTWGFFWWAHTFALAYTTQYMLYNLEYNGCLAINSPI
jgi:hypothetical protein